MTTVVVAAAATARRRPCRSFSAQARRRRSWTGRARADAGLRRFGPTADGVAALGGGGHGSTKAVGVDGVALSLTYRATMASLALGAPANELLGGGELVFFFFLFFFVWGWCVLTSQVEMFVFHQAKKGGCISRQYARGGL